jgi:acyl-CoA synthetase (AMP-forming)/AMP-acid ligase II
MCLKQERHVRSSPNYCHNLRGRAQNTGNFRECITLRNIVVGQDTLRHLYRRSVLVQYVLPNIHGGPVRLGVGTSRGCNRGAFTVDEFYRTGDMVRLHPTGNLVVEGRRKDLINRAAKR